MHYWLTTLPNTIINKIKDNIRLKNKWNKYTRKGLKKLIKLQNSKNVSIT